MKLLILPDRPAAPVVELVADYDPSREPERDENGPPYMASPGRFADYLHHTVRWPDTYPGTN